MRRCWHEKPLQRPTFTQLREEFDGIMCQDGIYFSFHSDEDMPCDHEVDGINAGAIANSSMIVEADVHCEHSELRSAEETSV